MKLKLNQWLLLASGVVLLFVVGLALKSAGLFSVFSNGPESATSLSVVVLLGLALIVVLMIALAIVYSVLDLTVKSEALGLPEGSVRALIAFSLVTIFVLMAAFLYRNVSDLGPGTTITRIPKAQIDELKKDFVVVAVPATKADGSPDLDTDGKTPLYQVKYFVRHNKDTDDFAKQIFTTLATVFVSVISFYFGSSASISGAGAVAKAMASGTKKNPPSITQLDPDHIAIGSGDTPLKI